MKRSARVDLFLLLSAASALTDCNRSRRCVDANNLVVDDRYCSGAPSSAYVYHWYYGGSGGGVGARATGGSFTPSESGTAHGVFGSAGEAHAGGGAHGGGAGE
ncbi:MAG: hypothetical protein KGN84_18690 [Acidobacteriota bacterium]|nr:hypothetical protein [Acidobacteriota bacterium]